ncbi:MAG: hypothetical protein L0H73_03060 [Nitrococcus sp.]|nr:hypothetical protein [Nitrococcus sp.]
MALTNAKYEEIRKQMQPGDVIAFSGKGNISEIIRWATRSHISHIGVVFASKVAINDEAQQGVIIDVMESSTLSMAKQDSQVITGVRRHRLSDYVQYYEGSIWWLPLSTIARAEMNFEVFKNFLLHQDEKEYDVPQAIMSAIDLLERIPILSSPTANVEDFSKFFCSELVAAAFEKAGLIESINASEVTPIDLCMFNIYTEEYYQIKGDRTEIQGYNTVSPEKFGE